MANTIGYQVTVANTATSLEPAADVLDGAGGMAMCVRNRGSVSVYLGGSGVTSSTGFELAAGEALAVAHDKAWVYGLYAITASSTARVDVLKVTGDA